MGPKLLATIGIVVVNIVLWFAYFVIVVVFFLGALVIFVVTLPFDSNKRILHLYSCLWASMYLWCNPYWSLRKRGFQHVERDKAYVIVVNHQSIADILLVFNTFLPFKWVAKKAAFNLPFLGWNMRLNEYVPIERGDGESREKCLRACREWLAKGASVVFFPEGTRSKDGNLIPFKIGAFRLAVESGHDILPIVIRGSLHAIPIRSLLLHRKSRMSLEVLPPIPVHSYQGNPTGAESLMNHVRIMMKSKLS